MIAAASPTVRRRRLAAELRAIRESKGKSGDAVAAALKWSPSKISRYERARTGLRPREVERLLDYYKITGSRRDLLLALAEEASQKGWWEEFSDTLSEDYQQFIGLEHEATSIAIWHVDVVAGLLQTEAYARHIIGSYSRVEPIAPGMVGRLVRVRMRRQEVLDREGFQLSVVLDESVLHRRIGDDSVMYEQLLRLAREAGRPNVTMQVLPLNAQHSVFGESFVIFGFGTDSDAMLQDVVSTEHLRSGFTLEGERETYLHRIAFQMLGQAALDPEASRTLILRTAESRWSVARQGNVAPVQLPPADSGVVSHVLPARPWHGMSCSVRLPSPATSRKDPPVISTPTACSATAPARWRPVARWPAARKVQSHGHHPFNFTHLLAAYIVIKRTENGHRVGKVGIVFAITAEQGRRRCRARCAGQGRGAGSARGRRQRQGAGGVPGRAAEPAVPGGGGSARGRRQCQGAAAVPGGGRCAGQGRGVGSTRAGRVQGRGVPGSAVEAAGVVPEGVVPESGRCPASPNRRAGLLALTSGPPVQR